MKLLTLLALGIALVTLTAAPPIWACSVAGPNTHMGTVTAVDAAKGTLTLKDAETSKDITFVADKPEMLAGIAPNDHVTVVFAAQGKTLHVKTIKKG